MQRALADLARAGLIDIGAGVGRTRRYLIDRPAVARVSGQPAAPGPQAAEPIPQPADSLCKGSEKRPRGDHTEGGKVVQLHGRPGVPGKYEGLEERLS